MEQVPKNELMTLPGGAGLPITIEQLNGLVRAVAADRPELEHLNPDQLRAVARGAILDELKSDFRRRVMGERVDWAAEVEAFISDCRSPRTRKAYSRALGKLKVWAGHKGITFADLNPRLCDDFVRDLRALGEDADYTRLTIAACSSFFGFLERRYDEIRNGFRGCRIRPRATWAVAVVPSSKEIETMIREADPLIGAAVRVMAETGLRVGGLPDLTIRADGSYFTQTKGRRFDSADTLPGKSLDAIRSAGLDARRPFAGLPYADPSNALQVRICRLTKRLHADGKITAPFSAHDLRHFFAEKHKSRGLHWLCARLGHASVSVTERYLRNVLEVKTADL